MRFSFSSQDRTERDPYYSAHIYAKTERESKTVGREVFASLCIYEGRYSLSLSLALTHISLSPMRKGLGKGRRSPQERIRMRCDTGMRERAQSSVSERVWRFLREKSHTHIATEILPGTKKERHSPMATKSYQVCVSLARYRARLYFGEAAHRVHLLI